jgi:4'-phosphopantetheinyl transferase
MVKSEKDSAIISITTIREVEWLDYRACTYADELALFRYKLDASTERDTYLQSLLQPDEISRAQRYHQPADRQRFIYSRAVLRALLGKHVNEQAGQILLSEGINKKPVLSNYPNVFFNVSHSGDWVLIAISRMRVGVDVEQIRPDFPVDDLLDSICSPKERAWIYKGADDIRLSFYQLWTRKEALVKATGKGISDAFQHVPSLDGLYSIESDLINAVGQWVVGGFILEEGYPASIAYNGEVTLPKFYTLDGGFFNYCEP